MFKDLLGLYGNEFPSRRNEAVDCDQTSPIKTRSNHVKVNDFIISLDYPNTSFILVVLFFKLVCNHSSASVEDTATLTAL